MNFASELISIIVPVRRPNDLVQESLDSLLAQNAKGYQTEIVVINNSFLPMLSMGPQIKVFHEAQVGPQHARNCGLQAARGRWVAFVDCDVILANDWLALMMQSMEVKGHYGAQSALISTATSSKSLFGRFRALSDGLCQSGLNMANHFLPILNTSACIYDRHKLGDFKFNVNYKKCEDAELSWRLYHRHGCSWGYVMDAKAYCYYRPECYITFLKRNFSLGAYYNDLIHTYAKSWPFIKQWQRVKMKEGLRSQSELLRSHFSLPALMRVLATYAFVLGMKIKIKRHAHADPAQVEGNPMRATEVPNGTLLHNLRTGQRVFNSSQQATS